MKMLPWQHHSGMQKLRSHWVLELDQYGAHAHACDVSDGDRDVGLLTYLRPTKTCKKLMKLFHCSTVAMALCVTAFAPGKRKVDCSNLSRDRS